MTDQRHARFSSIDGLRPGDLQMAGEVWLDEITKVAWTTREAIKLAGYMVRHMAKPQSAPMSLAAMEGQLQLSPEQTKVTLKLMLMFGALDALSIGRDEVRVALNLSLLQKLRVLEAQRRYEELSRAAYDEAAQASWQPETPAAPEPAAELRAAS